MLELIVWFELHAVSRSSWLVKCLLQDLIGKMLQVNVGARYTADEVLEHSWVQVRTHTHTFVSLYQWGRLSLNQTHTLTCCHELVLVCKQDDAMMDTNMACEIEDGVESEITQNNTAADAEVNHTHSHTHKLHTIITFSWHCASFSSFTGGSSPW